MSLNGMHPQLSSTMKMIMTSMPSMMASTMTSPIKSLPPYILLLPLVGYGTGTNQVATHTLGIKTNVVYGNLLHKLLLCMANTITNKPCLKYVLIGTTKIIGLEPYKQFICANNATTNILVHMTNHPYIPS